MTVRLHPPDALPALPEGLLPPELAARVAAAAPDAVVVAADGPALGATAALWCGDADTPARIGCLAVRDPEAGTAALDAALRELAGAARVLAPLDGATWRAYRLAVDLAPDGGAPEPPFWLEPPADAAVQAALTATGFAPVAGYHSAIVDRLEDQSAAHAAALDRLAAVGVAVRPLDPARPERDLRAMHAVSRAAFVDNAFYAPLGFEAFAALYRPLLGRVPPELVLLAERDGAPVGLGFGYPDAAQALRGRPVTRVVVKTIAAVPAARGLGLGRVFTRALEEAGRRMGLVSAVHALMHDGNRSTLISRRHGGRLMRRYALFGRDLP